MAKSAPPQSQVRVRMYRQGLGDCFLLTWPSPAGEAFHVLIDCGIILGTRDADTLMSQVAANIVVTTGGKIDVLVATHEHWDHVSGFTQAAKEFGGMKVGQVWLAWTEDPQDATARRLRRERAHKLAGLWQGVARLRQRLHADGNQAGRETLEQAAEVLSFFGIEAADAPPAALGAALSAAGQRTAAAMEWVLKQAREPRFCTPGEIIEVAPLRAYVLGPPRQRDKLFKDAPTRRGRETYEEEQGHHVAAAAAFFSAASDNLAGEAPFRPFDARHRLSAKEAARCSFYGNHYFGEGDDAGGWRRIEGEWLSAAADFALQLDSDTNNTSLALAFELPDHQVLLFPGDAQVGNWESWHQDARGRPRTWKVDGREITTEVLLNRTVVYKVGHHGSHNATLRQEGLEMMTDERLVALVPVDEYVAHEKKRWKRMPFQPLMSRLHVKAQGRILQADRPIPASLKASARDSKEQIEVEGPDGKLRKRALYVDYQLPFENQNS